MKFISKKNKLAEKNAANPYIEGIAGRREWNDRYMNMSKAIRNWQLAFGFTMLLAIGLLIQVIRLSSESRIQPFVVETCQGNPLKIAPVTANLPNEDRLLNFAMSQFVINSRTIISDTEAQKSLLNKVYAYSADKTIAFLHDYYAINNPFDLSAKYTTQINIINAMPISAHTWQVTWDEIQKGNNTSNTMSRYIATLSYRFGEVNPKFINENPFGIYITTVSWSQIPMMK